MTDDPATKSWQLDKRIPLALIVAILIQTLGFAYWTGTLSQRVTSLEATRMSQMDSPGRIIRLETQVDGIKSTLQRVESKLDRLIEQKTEPRP